MRVVPTRDGLLCHVGIHRRIEGAEDARAHLGREPPVQDEGAVILVPEGEAAIFVLRIGAFGLLRTSRAAVSESDQIRTSCTGRGFSFRLPPSQIVVIRPICFSVTASTDIRPLFGHRSTSLASSFTAIGRAYEFPIDGELHHLIAAFSDVFVEARVCLAILSLGHGKIIEDEQPHETRSS